MDRVTKPQKKMLITLLRETKYMEGKKEKEWYWEKIQAALNTIGPKKTIIQWKKCWRDMRLTTRKKLAELKRCQLAGGSPPPGIELNQEDNDIIEIVGTEYFYEEMNGELKPENFMTNFDYVPENFCDAILSAAGQQSATAAAHMQSQHAKEQQQQQQQQHAVHQQQQQQQAATDHHGNETDTNDAASSANHDSHAGVYQPNLNAHNSNEHQAASLGMAQHAGMTPHAAVLHSGLHPHLLRRQQQQHAAMQRENMFEEKLMQFMQDVFPKRSKRRKCRDPDKLFLLSLYDEIKRIPEETRLDVKAELIQVIKKYQKKATAVVKQEKSMHTHKQNLVDKLSPHAANINAHTLYQMPATNNSKYDKCDNEPHSPQSQHSLDASVNNVSMPQQMPHAMFQLPKKYEDVANVDKQQQQQNEQQRKQAEAAAVAVVHHQQQQHAAAHQQAAPPPPPTTNEQQQQQQQQQAAHMHHAQMPHGIMFPLPPQQPPTQAQQQQAAQTQSHAHNPHNPHQQQQQPPPHHTPAIFGGGATDRPTLTYENVGRS